MQKDKEQIKVQIQHLKEVVEELEYQEKLDKSRKLFSDVTSGIESGKYDLTQFIADDYNNETYHRYFLQIRKRD